MITLRTEIPFDYIGETYRSSDVYLDERQLEHREQHRVVRLRSNLKRGRTTDTFCLGINQFDTGRHGGFEELRHPKTNRVIDLERDTLVTQK